MTNMTDRREASNVANVYARWASQPGNRCVKMTVTLRWLSQGDTVAFGLSTCDHGTRLVDLGVDGRGEDPR